MVTRIKNSPGDKFGRLTLIEKIPNSMPPKWLCGCECGTRCAVRQDGLRRGSTSSCGCYRREVTGGSNRSHGLSRSHPLYKLWLNMRDRCNRPACKDFSLYGGAGIKVSPLWDSFTQFCADVGDRPSLKHSLDRVDGAKGYGPGNVRWATPTEQSRNRVSVKTYSFGAKSLTLPEWAEQLGIPRNTLRLRLVRQGLSVEEAFTRPSRYSRGFANGSL